ncbi:hypothetical protein R3W88_014632 [Solanum pinnatisectum]|uniref:Uncharacterized protein n=1 Tax=Solanum pinnatisectum TaxID=50273 RepID=A0AAV9KSJ2_9SOLN|nr:hypothetical protein R3W88_014632 [Solanum pinnatisectum]
MDNLKDLPNHKALDKQSSSNLSNNDVLMRSLVQKDETERISNLDCHEVVVVLHQEVDKVKEGEDEVFAHLNKSNELDSEFSPSVGKECSRSSKFDKLSSSNISMDVIHLMSPLFQEVQDTSFANLELQNVVPKDKVHREINVHVVVTLAKNEELTINFSYNEENMEQVPISQSLEIKNNEKAHMEKGLPYEDNYGEKEMIVNLTNNVKFVIAADFTLDTGENDKEGVCSTTNFSLPEVAPPMKIGNAKEGEKTTLEDSHGKEDYLISHDNRFTNMDNFDLFSPIEGEDWVCMKTSVCGLSSLIQEEILNDPSRRNPKSPIEIQSQNLYKPKIGNQIANVCKFIPKNTSRTKRNHLNHNSYSRESYCTYSLAYPQ